MKFKVGDTVNAYGNTQYFYTITKDCGREYDDPSYVVKGINSKSEGIVAGKDLTMVLAAKPKKRYADWEFA